MAEKAHINPVILKWARESAKISAEAAAHHVDVTPERLLAWEEGSEQPTIKKAERLAHYYRRPFAVLFLPRIPRDFQVLQDFRSKGGEFSTALTFIIRELQEKQAWVRSVFEESGEGRLSYVGKFDRRTSPDVVALDIRKTLGITTSDIGTKPLKYWIQKAEAARLFISLSSNFHSRLKLDSEEVKGFAVADPYAPFVFLNTDDWDNSQLFTLVHELSHIWINQSGVSVDIQIALREGEGRNINPVEVFCNQVAAAALMPENEIAEAVSQNTNTSGMRKVETLAKLFGVSSLAMLYRLHNLRYIPEGKFYVLRREAEKSFEQYIERVESTAIAQDGAPNYYILQMRRNGRAFSQLVMDFYKGGHITGLDASRLLKVKLNNFSAFEKYLYR